MGGEWETETGIWLLQTSRRYLNSVGRSVVRNGDEFRIAITQSRQSVKYAFFSFILHHFYQTSVSMQLARALGWSPAGLAYLLRNSKKKMKTVQLSDQVEGIIST